jgi:hypothetical protein
MRTRLTLKAGEPGTRKLVEEYGDRLLYVRYRYDEERQLRLKTAEIVVDTRTWHPSHRPPPGDLLDYVHIRFDPTDAQTKTAVKRLGGYWDPEATAWRITRAAATLLDLNPMTTSHPPAPPPSLSTDR